MSIRTAFSVAAAGLFFVAAQVGAATTSITANPITGPNGIAGADWYMYKYVGPTTLTRDETASINTILQGSAPVAGNSAPFGNVELFANSELPPFVGVNAVAQNGAFHLATRTSISGTLQGAPITLSSLNGNDWFNSPGPYDTNYAAIPATLAQKWYNDFLARYNFDGVLTNALVDPPTIVAERQNLFNQLRDGGGFQRISDPNISYVNQDTDTNEISIGLAGTQGFLKSAVLLYVNNSSLTGPQKASVIAQLTPVDIQASELVRVDYNGGPAQYLYGFSAAGADLHASDPSESYDANFNLTIPGVPEPTSLALIALAIPLVRRRK